MLSISKRFLTLLILSIPGMSMALPEIVTQPSSKLEAPLDSDVDFTVEAQGEGDLTYQWQLNGVNIPGATDTSLYIEQIRPEHAGNYTVTVTEYAGEENEDS